MTDFNKFKNRKTSFVERETTVPVVLQGLEKWRNGIEEITEKRPWVTESEI